MIIEESNKNTYSYHSNNDNMYCIEPNNNSHPFTTVQCQLLAFYSLIHSFWLKFYSLNCQHQSNSEWRQILNSNWRKLFRYGGMEVKPAWETCCDLGGGFYFIWLKVEVIFSIFRAQPAPTCNFVIKLQPCFQLWSVKTKLTITRHERMQMMLGSLTIGLIFLGDLYEFWVKKNSLSTAHTVRTKYHGW